MCEDDGLEIEPQWTDSPCDGCGKAIKEGESVLTGITSCCGGGCYRQLCMDCIRRAYVMLEGLH